jgi:predicted AAA+ superfamily ATPase
MYLQIARQQKAEQEALAGAETASGRAGRIAKQGAAGEGW